MGRLRVRDANNIRWIDICQSEFYVRNASNTAWYRLLPARGLSVRHGSNEYWIPIGCTTDDPTMNCPDEYGGTPDGNGENGSGPGNPSGGGGGGNGGGDNGGGDNGGGGGNGGNGGGVNTGGGTDFDPNSPYSPGYGLVTDADNNSGSDDGNGDSSLIDAGNGDLVLLNPDGDAETFDPGKDDLGGNGGDNSGGGGNGSDGGKGTFADPYVCPVSISGRGYQVTEFYVDLGQVSGTVKVHYNIIGRASIDVYHGGKLKASTKGKKTGRGVLKWEYSVAQAKGSSKVFIRVRADKGSSWNVLVQCPAIEEQDDYGTPSQPATCRGTFSPNHGGGAGVHENTHTMGKSGKVVIEYQMWYQPDKMDILYRGQIIASTNTFVSGTGRLVFNLSAVGSDTDITVRVTSLDGTTSWTYIMTCPDETGSSLYPKPCGNDSATTSGGAGITDTYFDLTGEKAGTMAVRYQMWNIPDTCEVYQNGTLIATTNSPVAGENRLRFEFNPANGTELRVRIIGPDNKTSWSFLIECPDDATPPVINAGNVSVREGAAGQTSQMCFPVTLSKASTSPVTVDYATAGGTATGTVANARILARDSYNNPFIAVVDGVGVGKVVMDGGFPKFYNNRWVEPLPQPSSDSVFNSWSRMANGEYYVNNAATPSGSQAKSWTYNSENASISATINSSAYIGFISPDPWANYAYECTLSSNDDDDDTIGVIAAFVREGSSNQAIMAVRQQGGNSYAGGNNNFALFYSVNGAPTTLIEQRNFGTTSSRWSGKYTRVRVEREGDIIRVYCSNWNSTTIDPSSVLTVDLNSNADFARFKGQSRFGFTAFSQLGARFSEIQFEGIGMEPAFTYMKNAVRWMANPSSPAPKKVLIVSDAVTAANYSIGTKAADFGIGVPKAIQSLGYTTVLSDMAAWGVPAAIPLSVMKQYAAIVYFGSAYPSAGKLTAETANNFAQYVADGYGLFLITDHDVFQESINLVAKKFNARFYGSVDRSPVSVAAMISAHGDHPIWDGLQSSTLFATGSEGNIEITQTNQEYKPKSGTVTFAPGETSKTVCIDTYGDGNQEADKTVNIVLSNPNNGSIGTGTGVGTIIDDDSPLCKQNPTAPVYERAGGPNGSYLIYVQPDFNCAAGNTMYLMMRDFNFANSGAHVFQLTVDDDYELYIDCKLVATGTIGAVRTHTINVSAGLRNLILRYSNVPACTPSYVAMSIQYQGNVVMVTRGADWKGQANVLGSL